MSDELVKYEQWFPICNSSIIYNSKYYKDPFNWTLCGNKMYIKIYPSDFNKFICLIDFKENKSTIYFLPSSTFSYCFEYTNPIPPDFIMMGIPPENSSMYYTSQICFCSSLFLSKSTNENFINYQADEFPRFWNYTSSFYNDFLQNSNQFNIVKSPFYIHNINSEDVISPSEDVISPSEDVISPSKEVISPSKEVISPSKEVISPSKEVISPSKEVISPSLEVISPSLEVISPSLEVISPSLEVISPSLELIIQENDLIDLIDEKEPLNVVNNKKTKKKTKKKSKSKKTDINEDIDEGKEIKEIKEEETNSFSKMGVDELFEFTSKMDKDEIFEFARNFIEARDYDTACKFLRMAYVKGKKECAVILGKIHISLDQIDEAFKWFYMSARVNKDPEGMVYLGDCYYFSVGIKYKGEENLRTAFNFYKEASLHNNADALFKLSLFYKNDYSFLKKDNNKSFTLCKLSAELGSEKGQINTAINYLIGKGTVKNIKLTIYWLKKAIAQGNKTAIIMMETIATKEKNKEAIEWVQLNKDKCVKVNEIKPVVINSDNLQDPRQIEMLKCVDWDKYIF